MSDRDVPGRYPPPDGEDRPVKSVEQIGEALTRQVLEPLKRRFVEKDEIIDLLGLCLIGGENLFLLGPPGTAKSALVRAIATRIQGRTFEVLLTRFTEPSEVFGPFDIRRLREGELVTNTEGMLPDAHWVFLDELLNANSAILNSLLNVLNERVYRRGKEQRALPTLSVVAASNRLPDDDTLQALFDRFLVRVDCNPVSDGGLASMIEAGWELEFDATEGLAAAVNVEEIRRAQSALAEVDLSPVRAAYVRLVSELRRAGIALSDRRVVKLQRLLAASSLLCGRKKAEISDLWVVRHTWDRIEQQQIVRSLVSEAIGSSDFSATAHPRALSDDRVSAETLARDVEQLAATLRSATTDRVLLSQTRDQLAALSARCAWVDEEDKREALHEEIAALWKELQ